MPTQQRRRGDDPMIPRLPGQQPAQHRQHDPVGRLQIGPAHLPAKNLNFLTQHQQLDVLTGFTPPRRMTSANRRPNEA